MPEVIVNGLWSKVIIYSIGSVIYYMNLSGRRVQPVMIRNDFMSELLTEVYDNEITYAYINNKNEMIYGVIGEGVPLIALADTTGVNKPRKLKMDIIKEKLCLFYIADNPVTGNCELKYFVTPEIHEHKVLYETENSILKYDIFDISEEKYVVVYEKENSVSKIFKIEFEDTADEIKNIEAKIFLSENIREYEKIIRDCENSIKNRDVKIKKYEKEIKLHEEKIEDCELKIRENEKIIRQMKKKIKEYEDSISKYDSEISTYKANITEYKDRAQNAEKENEELKNNINYIKEQYEELSQLAKKIQEEGKKWRSLYNKQLNVDISTKKTI